MKESNIEIQKIYGDELLEPFDFEMDSRRPEDGGTTECGKLGRKHRMKRVNHSKTGCVYYGCDGQC